MEKIGEIATGPTPSEVDIIVEEGAEEEGAKLRRFLQIIHKSEKGSTRFLGQVVKIDRKHVFYQPETPPAYAIRAGRGEEIPRESMKKQTIARAKIRGKIESGRLAPNDQAPFPGDPVKTLEGEEIRNLLMGV